MTKDQKMTKDEMIKSTQKNSSSVLNQSTIKCYSVESSVSNVKEYFLKKFLKTYSSTSVNYRVQFARETVAELPSIEINLIVYVLRKCCTTRVSNSNLFCSCCWLHHLPTTIQQQWTFLRDMRAIT